MQKALVAKGYDVGKTDGLPGYKTRRSLGRWQAKKPAWRRPAIPDAVAEGEAAPPPCPPIPLPPPPPPPPPPSPPRPRTPPYTPPPTPPQTPPKKKKNAQAGSGWQAIRARPVASDQDDGDSAACLAGDAADRISVHACPPLHLLVALPRIRSARSSGARSSGAPAAPPARGAARAAGRPIAASAWVRRWLWRTYSTQVGTW